MMNLRDIVLKAEAGEPLNDAEMDAYEAFMDKYNKENPPWDKQTLIEKAKTVGENVMEPVGQVADFYGGLTRVGLAEIADALGSTKKELVNKGDWKQAAEGKAPTMKQLLQRAGDRNMGSLSDIIPGAFEPHQKGVSDKLFSKPDKGGWADITDQGLRGFASDQILDPLFWLTAGASGVAKTAGKARAAKTPSTWAGVLVEAAKDAAMSGVDKVASVGKLAARPATTVLRKVAPKVFKRGLKFADKATYARDPKYSGRMPSDVLYDKEFAGTADDLYRQTGDFLDRLSAEREPLREAARKSGNTGLPLIFLGDAEKVASNHAVKKTNPKGYVSDADALLEEIDALKKTGLYTFDELEETAKKFGKAARNSDPAMAGSAYGTSGDSSVTKQVYKGVSKGARNAAADIVESATPGGRDKYKSLNRDISALSNAKKSIASGAKTELGKFDVTTVDGLAAGLPIATGQNPWLGIPYLGVKKLGDAQKTTWLNTHMGRGMKRFSEGQTGDIMDSLVREWMRDGKSEEDLYQIDIGDKNGKRKK